MRSGGRRDLKFENGGSRPNVSLNQGLARVKQRKRWKCTTRFYAVAEATTYKDEVEGTKGFNPWGQFLRACESRGGTAGFHGRGQSPDSSRKGKARRVGHPEIQRLRHSLEACATRQLKKENSLVMSSDSGHNRGGKYNRSEISGILQLDRALNAKVVDTMLYKLWREKVRVGEVISDKPLVKGDIVQTVWRVVEPAWSVDAGDSTNARSSGDVLVEPVSPEHIS